MQSKIDPCETMRNNLIAAAIGLQQCTKTAADLVPLSDGRVIAIGTPADVERLLATQVQAAAPATIDTEEFRELLAQLLDAAEQAEKANDPMLYKPARDAFVAHINSRAGAAAPSPAAEDAAKGEQQADDAQIIAQQVAKWTRERDRLQDLINTATGTAHSEQKAAPEQAGNPWQHIDTLPYSDDLVWLRKGDSIEGPRVMSTDDYDRFFEWAPCEPPSAAPAGKAAAEPEGGAQ